MDQTDPRVAFINARLDEQAQRLKWARPHLRMFAGNEQRVFIFGPMIEQGERDVEAKREILAKHHPGRYGECVACDVGALSCGCCGFGEFPCDTVALLARPFADHEDYAALFDAEVSR
jgi:hypothetical protein